MECYACNYLNKEEIAEQLCGRIETACHWREKCGHCRLYPDGGGLCEWGEDDNESENE